MRASLLSCLFAFALPVLAQAHSLPAAPEENPFAHSEQVSDQELDTMRGGFLNMRNVMIDFSFLSRVQVRNEANNINDIQELLFSSDTFRQAQSNMQAQQQLQDQAQQASLQEQIQNAASLQPIIVQNTLSDTIITMRQVLDVTVTGAMVQSATQARLNALDLQSVSALRGL